MDVVPWRGWFNVVVELVRARSTAGGVRLSILVAVDWGPPPRETDMGYTVKAAILAVALVAAGCGGAGESVVVEAESTPTQRASISTPETVADPVEPTAAPVPQATLEPTAGPTPTPLATATPGPTATPEPTAAPPVAGPAETIVIEFTDDSYGFQSAYSFTATRDGSYRMDYGDGDVYVFDATESIGTSFVTFGDGDESVYREVGGAVGPPDLYGATYAVQGQAALNTLAREGTAFAGAGTLFGRDTVLFETALIPNAIGGGPDFETVVVDAETGIVLSYLGTLEGHPLVSLEAVSVETFPTRLDVFALDESIELGVPDYDSGFRPVSGLGEASEMLGYAVPIPAIVPVGYSIDAIRIAPGLTNGFTGAEASNPRNIDVVSIRYANGWRSFTISTRRVGEGNGFGWINPFSGEGQAYDVFRFTVKSGAFAGAVAEVATQADTVPHLWADTGEFVFTVTGPLSESEMVGMVETLALG